MYGLLNAVVSEKTGVKPKKPCFFEEKSFLRARLKGIRTIHTYIHIYIYTMVAVVTPMD